VSLLINTTVYLLLAWTKQFAQTKAWFKANTYGLISPFLKNKMRFMHKSGIISYMTTWLLHASITNVFVLFYFIWANEELSYIPF
jgi:hypothetical protein